MKALAASVDIGSTFTKAALFSLEPGRPALRGSAQVPTTQDDLGEGVRLLLDRLLGLPPGGGLDEASSRADLFFCSSAKGGLSIAAVGIVPDLTVTAARLAAASAGGRIAMVSSYRLTPDRLRELERLSPDILLLCGGTDGGNEDILLGNARAVAGSALKATVLFAGNASVREDARRILAAKDFAAAGNVMPEVGTLSIESARAEVRRIFLERIVEGRGLKDLERHAAAPVKPTPLAVYEAVGVLADGNPEWDQTMVIDMGGATTDAYSVSQAFAGGEGWVLRGLAEPRRKRTVEGDLGLRIGAVSAFETGRAYIEARLAGMGIPMERMRLWIGKAVGHPESLAEAGEELVLEDVLAEACVYHALLRHAGTVEEVWTPSGKVRIQKGKDLRGIRRIAGSGGYLARRGDPGCLLAALEAARRDSGGLSLLPERPRFFRDQDYLLPLIGNLAEAFPAEAALLAQGMEEVS
jgi:uncharacterized protein (TIGR01319 family)